MILSLSGNTWTQIIVAFSIFGPLTVAIVLTVVVLRGKRSDPDEQRMRRAQTEYERRRDSDRR